MFVYVRTTRRYYDIDDDNDDDDGATEVQTINLFVTKHRDDGTIYNLKHPGPSLLIILITTKPYQTWYSQLHVGVLVIYRREWQRNHNKILLGL